MKHMLLAVLLTPLLSGAPAARSFEQLAAACVPGAPLATLRPLVRVESGFHPNALSVNYPESVAKKLGYRAGRVRLKRQPQSREQAWRWATQLAAHGITVSVGLTQVNTEDAARAGIDARALLDPCTNLQVGWAIFRRDYAASARRFGPGQTALRQAFSLYNTGHFNSGFQNGYVEAILHAAR